MGLGAPGRWGPSPRASGLHAVAADGPGDFAMVAVLVLFAQQPLNLESSRLEAGQALGPGSQCSGLLCARSWASLGLPDPTAA